MYHFNKKQYIALITLSIVCVSLFWTMAPSAVEATTFTPITQQGDVPENLRPQGGDLVGLLNNLFIIALGAGALLAVLMITIGGIQYMGTDSYSSKDSAKTRIREAVIGLIILLGSWLFLFTINPDLVNLNMFQTAKRAGPVETAPTGSQVSTDSSTSSWACNSFTNATCCPLEANSIKGSTDTSMVDGEVVTKTSYTCMSSL